MVLNAKGLGWGVMRAIKVESKSETWIYFSVHWQLQKTFKPTSKHAHVRR